jgi:Chaperone of endosialidase
MKILFKSALFFVLLHGICFAQVGIGTSSPVSKLEVVGAGNTSGTSSLHVKNSSNTSLLYIRDDGNIGLGTSSPSSKLNIVGGGVRIFNGFANNSTARPAINTSSIGNYEIRGVGGAGSSTQSDAGDDGFLRLSAGGGTSSSSQSYIDLSGYSGVADMNRNIVLGVAGTERMRITSGGSVGIGTTAPAYKLQVLSDNNTYSNPQVVVTSNNGNASGGLAFGGLWNSEALNFYTQGSATPKMYISSDGKVGIGTTSPESLLHIAQSNSAAATTLYIDNTAASATGNEAVLKFSVDAGGSVTTGGAGISAIQTSAGAGYTDLRFLTFGSSSYAEQMRITSAGLVGIGTSSPSYNLHVMGSIFGSVSVTSSDNRLKNISESISSDDSISTIRYEWKDGRDDRVHIGYGAQEVERILPDAVYTGNDGIKSVNYDEVHTYKLMRQELLIKELQQQIEELQKIVNRKRRIK